MSARNGSGVMSSGSKPISSTASSALPTVHSSASSPSTGFEITSFNSGKNEELNYVPLTLESSNPSFEEGDKVKSSSSNEESRVSERCWWVHKETGHKLHFSDIKFCDMCNEELWVLQRWAGTRIYKLTGQQVQKSSLAPPQSATANNQSKSKMLWQRMLSKAKKSNSKSKTEDSTSGFGQIIGRPLSEVICAEGSTMKLVPNIVKKCVEDIEKRGMSAEGIFRVSGSAKRIQDLNNTFDQGKEPDFSVTKPYDVASVLKNYFRKLPEPLLTADMYEAYVQTNRLQQNGANWVHAIQLLNVLLPKENRDTLEYLVTFLNKIHEMSEKEREGGGNLMTAHNLSLIFAPNILRKGTPDAVTAKAKLIKDNRPIEERRLQLQRGSAGAQIVDKEDDARAVVEFLILNCKVLFQIDGDLRDDALRWAMVGMPGVLSPIFRHTLDTMQKADSGDYEVNEMHIVEELDTNKGENSQENGPQDTVPIEYGKDSEHVENIEVSSKDELPTDSISSPTQIVTSFVGPGLAFTCEIDTPPEIPPKSYKSSFKSITNSPQECELIKKDDKEETMNFGDLPYPESLLNAENKVQNIEMNELSEVQKICKWQRFRYAEEVHKVERGEMTLEELKNLIGEEETAEV